MSDQITVEQDTLLTENTQLRKAIVALEPMYTLLLEGKFYSDYDRAWELLYVMKRALDLGTHDKSS